MVSEARVTVPFRDPSRFRIMRLRVPLENLVVFLARDRRYVTAEFVPKQDTQIRGLLAMREDVLRKFDEKSFKRAFGRLFDTGERALAVGSSRTLYWM